MLDKNSDFAITIPNPPYPLCTVMIGSSTCKGRLLPCLEPASGQGKDMYGQQFVTWVKGTIVLFWKCSECGRRI